MLGVRAGETVCQELIDAELSPVAVAATVAAAEAELSPVAVGATVAAAEALAAPLCVVSMLAL